MPHQLHDLPLERLVVEQFLAEPRWSIARLKTRLNDVNADELDLALVALVAEDVLVHEGATMRLSRCAHHLTALRDPPLLYDPQ